MSAKKSDPGEFHKILEQLAHRHNTRRIFDAFILFAACCLAAQTREAEYLEEVKRWERPDLDVFAEPGLAFDRTLRNHTGGRAASGAAAALEAPPPGGLQLGDQVAEVDPAPGVKRVQTADRRQLPVDRDG